MTVKIKPIRMILLMVLTLAIFAGFSLRLMNWQITQGSYFRNQADQTSVAGITITAPRGDILDRYGRILATNSVQYSVQMIRPAFTGKNASNLNTTVLTLIHNFQATGQSWSDTLPIGNAPYGFMSDAGAATARKFLENTVDALPTDHSKWTQKQKAAYAADEAATADQVMTILQKRYKVSGDIGSQDVRNVIGVRYEMEVEGFATNNPFTIASNVSLDLINRIGEQSLPGIYISPTYTRSYVDGTAAPQILGTVGPIQASDDYKKKLKSKGYKLNDLIGHGGIEQTQEDSLRGVDGKANLILNSQGVVVGETVIQAAKPGSNVQLTIDSGLQKTLSASLASTIAMVVGQSGGSAAKGAQCDSGAAVAISVKTGEVLGMASYPSYDVSTYSQNVAALNKDSTHPLLNRAIQGTYRPGSTFKPVTAVAGLMYNAITPTSTINCTGVFDKYSNSGYTGHEDGNAYYGQINVVRALAKSSNVFFDTVADRLNIANSKYVENTAKSLGLGVKTGIELTGEQQGVVSGPSAKSPWYPADACQSGIGQLLNQYTPLQLSSYVATLVNGGTHYQPHIVLDVRSHDNTTLVSETAAKADTSFQIPADALATVKQGLGEVTDDGGTAGTVFSDLPIKSGGKTGTAEINTSRTLFTGVYIGFVPFDDPQVAIAVVLDKSDWGYHSGYVAADAMRYLFLHTPDESASPLPTAAGHLIY